MINLYNLQRAVTTSNKVARRNCQFYWKGTTNKNQEAKRLYWIEDYWKDTDNVEEGKKVILFGTVYYVIKRGALLYLDPPLLFTISNGILGIQKYFRWTSVRFLCFVKTIFLFYKFYLFFCRQHFWGDFHSNTAIFTQLKHLEPPGNAF